MKVFLKLEPDGAGITALATQYVAGVFDVEAELPKPFDPQLVGGYELRFNPDTGKNEAIFDVMRYRQAKARKAEEKRQQAADGALTDALHQAALELATDEQAVVMMDLYPAWEAGKEYKEGDRLTYKGCLYKVVQTHTSQTGWEPANVPAVFTRLSDPAAEWPDFVQPTGAHDVYMAGDKVTFKDEHYTCTADYTAHSPEEYPDAWTKAE